MPQPKPPTPLPRKHLNLFDPQGKLEDDEPLKCSSAPQSPTNSGEVWAHSSPVSATEPVTKDLGCSSPPPVAPKKWTVRRSPTGNKVFMEKVKMLDQCLKDKNEPPPLSPKSPEIQGETKTLDAETLSNSYEENTPWKTLSNDLNLRGVAEEVAIEVKALQLYKAFSSYILLVYKHHSTLKDHIGELGSIADNLDKVSKGTKIAGITGGATTVAGGVAAAAGVILSPFTLGASLALTAVGVGVAAAGGVTGASAAIANKVNCNQDQKKIEKHFNDYDSLSKDIQASLGYVHEGMEQLRQHALTDTTVKSKKASKVLQLFVQGGACAKALEANSKTSGLIKGFALGMDMYFTQGKDGPKVKKGFESKLAKKIRMLAEELQKGLDEFIKIQDLFLKHC